MRIFEFAKITDWESRLSDLAQLAEPERWTFISVPDNSHLPVLDSFIRHTFQTLSSQQKISESEHLACFNTGLLTEGQEEIFGVFERNSNYTDSLPVSVQNKKWFLKQWARAGDRILTSFIRLPGLPAYWQDPGDLIFNPALEVQLNIDHIIRDNLTRFPIELGGKLGQNGVPSDFNLGEPEDEPMSLDSNNQAATIQIPLATRNALEGAMKHSIRLAQRSYRIAVPQYYWGKIQLLLPLYLRSSTKVDLALTLEKHGGWYRAATVLYSDWAYRHARLLARPNSEWLGGFPINSKNQN